MLRFSQFRRGIAACLVASAAVSGFAGAAEPKPEEGWISLFNGKDFTGWKMVDPPSGEFKLLKEVKNDDGKVTAFIGVTKKDAKEVTLWEVKDGMIVGGGPASHIFTEVEADDFQYRVEAKINDKGNSGQYCRTAFGAGFPAGYEIQINATHGDRVKTGSLYPAGPLGKFRDQIVVLDKAPHEPDEFFTQQVTVVGNKISIEVNGKKTIEFVDEANNYKTGHFALQQHDPGSKVCFKKIEVKELPADGK